MSLSLIGMITLGVGLFAAFRSMTMALTMLCCFGLLGAASAMAFGGANITPGHLTIAFLILAVIIRKNGIGYATLSMQQGRAGILLAVLCLWGFASSMLMPRLFAGSFLVFPMNTDSKFIIQVPLYPAGANFNQAVYFVSALFIFACVSSIARTNEALRKCGAALIIAGAVNVIIVAIDTATFAVGATNALDFIRNAEYSQNFAHKFMGVKRVTGAFPEASSFAMTSVGLFAFNFRLWRGGIHPQWTGLIALATFFAILFAFSTTGYLAMIAYLSVAYSRVLMRSDARAAFSPRSSTNRVIFIMLGPMVALGAATAVAIKPDLIAPIVETFDQSITNKLGSASGVERSSWNMSALENFFQSFGFGAGLGSVRASSFLVAVLSNLGIFGAILFALFFARLFLEDNSRRTRLADQTSQQYVSAAKAGCFAILVAAAVSWSTVDLGIHFYVMAGIACGALFYRRVPQRVEPKDVQEVPYGPGLGQPAMGSMNGQRFAE